MSADEDTEMILPRNLFISVLALALTASGADAQILTNITFVAIDTETTGLSPARSRIVEVAMLKFRGTALLASTSWLVNPLVPIPPEVSAIHGITDQMVSNAPPLSAIADEIHSFAADCPLIAHNAPFDMRILVAESSRYGFQPLTNEVLDSLVLARKWFPDAPSHELGALMAYLEIKTGQMHRALDDARCVQLLFLRGVQNLPPGATMDDVRKMMKRRTRSAARQARKSKTGVSKTPSAADESQTQ